MPLLLHRRSVLDLLNSKADDESLPRPHANALNGDPPLSPRPVSEYGYPASRLSHELLPADVSDETARPGPTPTQRKRFSLMKFRNYSESHLAVRARQDALRETAPPVPQVVVPEQPTSVPAIVRTAPTMDEYTHGRAEAERRVRPSLFRRSMSKGRSEQLVSRGSMDKSRDDKSKMSTLRWRRMQGRSTGLEDLARLSSIHAAANNQHSQSLPPPLYGDESNSALALPVPGPRFSESSQSDGSNASSGDHIYGSTTTTTHTVSTHTTFFKLPRRNKNRNSLFPLPVRLSPTHDESAQQDGPATPRASESAYSTHSMITPGAKNPPPTTLQRRHTENNLVKRQNSQHPPMPSPTAALAKSSLSFAEPGVNLFRNESQRSRNSSTSSPLQPPMRLGMRERASTGSSFGRSSHDYDIPPLGGGSGRNSTSTTGRSSLGGLLNLARFRQGSEPHSPRHGSPGTRSKSNSFALSREALVIPEREEGDTPGKYLERLEAAVARSVIAGILSKSADPFAQAVLRSYTRRFPFFGEPIDMSLRKFLLEAELPKETQQVDRVIQSFADRYQECNPGLFVSPDQAYIVAFSLMMLHTDAFNKNNKRKMQKQDYIKNTSGQQVADEILACFYDNICYTPFVHFDEEVDINGERVLPFRPKKSKLKGSAGEAGKLPSGPVDPYNLLVDQKLDLLRPPIKDTVTLEDPYNYRGSTGDLDPQYLQRAFTHTGVLQIISARSRPAAYEGHLGNANIIPAESQAGIVDLKITKVGTLWRKAAKKKKARSPWQEWGAILTGSQLYLFKNAHWAKGLMHQFMSQQKHGHPRNPVIFKPPLHDFKPDDHIKTDNAVALVDATYTRHKHAFTFSRAGGHDEVMLADNESELNDWLALINYAAAFRAAGVRIRGMVGGNEENLRRGEAQIAISAASSQSVQTPTGSVTVSRGGLTPQLQRQVMAARRQIMVQKIAEIEREITEANKQLDVMVRNARHLLVLAPLAPKSREDIVHAATRSDAMIQWLRRNIWRMKCHRDILAMDARQDGVTATEVQSVALAEQQSQTATEPSKKTKPSPLVRLGSRASAVLARSPPQSPTAGNRRSERLSMAGSIETQAMIGNDVFRTPPDSAADFRTSTGWTLPPVQDEPSAAEHRCSVTSTHLTVSTQGRPGSLSHTSSTSSVRPAARLDSSHSTATPPRNEPNAEERERVELLARATMATEPTRGMSLEGPRPVSTPETAKHRSVRRSLQKTLRDASHHGPGSSTRHRRGKESDGTIRSGSAGESVEGHGEASDVTPSLQREKGRFILHGKQASVIQFGSDWPNERMRHRREQWRQQSDTNKSDEDSSSFRRPSQTEWSDALSSPVMRAVSGTSADIDSEIEEEVSSSSRATTSHSNGFREDAEIARMFTASTASPERVPSIALEGAESQSKKERPETVYFDLSSWDPQNGKRSTVIGPQSGGTSIEGGKGGTGDVESDTEDFTLGPRDNRRTVIGPSKPVGSGDAEANAETDKSEQHVQPNEDEHGDEADDSMIDSPIDDEELRRIVERSTSMDAS